MFAIGLDLRHRSRNVGRTRSVHNRTRAGKEKTNTTLGHWKRHEVHRIYGLTPQVRERRKSCRHRLPLGRLRIVRGAVVCIDRSLHCRRHAHKLTSSRASAQLRTRDLELSVLLRFESEILQRRLAAFRPRRCSAVPQNRKSTYNSMSTYYVHTPRQPAAYLRCLNEMDNVGRPE